ncbi:hypothetical protein [Streptomyces sp. NBC_00568]|nr:hypothetical protein [Streptomyces sp. NBC_00568]MCX4993433.1 hypothetical protein [Streptomyces sp. NBC_00568]
MNAADQPASHSTPEPLVEPGPPPRWWEETPAEAARYDRMYWNED